MTFNAPGCVEALQYWIDLIAKYHAHPPGIVDWGTTPRDFLEGRVAMIWHTTGNLSNIRANAKFPFGVAMLPAHKRRGQPDRRRQFPSVQGRHARRSRRAALRFLRWVDLAGAGGAMGHRHRLCRHQPGCLGDAGDARLCGRVSRPPRWRATSCAFAVPELSTHDNQRVTQALNDELQAALLGRKPPAAALDDAQANATRLLRPYTR